MKWNEILFIANCTLLKSFVKKSKGWKLRRFHFLELQKSTILLSPISTSTLWNGFRRAIKLAYNGQAASNSLKSKCDREEDAIVAALAHSVCQKKDLSLYQIYRGDLISWVKMIFSKIFFLFFWYGHLNNRKKTITRMLFDIYKTMNQKVYTESRAIKLELVCNFSLWGCSSICAQSFCVPEFQWMKVSRHPFFLFLQLIPIYIYT